jgi:hypothetical protein
VKDGRAHVTIAATRAPAGLLLLRWRPGKRDVVIPMTGQVALSAAVSVHDVDLDVAVAVAMEGDRLSGG